MGTTKESISSLPEFKFLFLLHSIFTFHGNGSYQGVGFQNFSIWSVKHFVIMTLDFIFGELGLWISMSEGL